MALRLATKINRIIQNLGRTLSSEAAEATTAISSELEEKLTHLTAPNPSEGQRYQVCQPRVFPVTRFLHNNTSDEPESEVEICRKNVEVQHLQPALLPEYYKSAVEIEEGSFPDLEFTATEEATPRDFEESKTYSNVTLPLRGHSLSNPFPDPVKIMQSHTISDEEKQSQMFSDSRMTKLTSKQNQFMPSVRFFCSDEKKCKIGKEKTKRKSCTKRLSPDCDPPKSISCNQKDYKFKECTKTEAPYPSYSESCHEEIEEKPSECKMCPWKAEENPNFKPPKSHYHTSSALFQPMRKGDCQKPPNADRKPCGWVELEKKRKNKDQSSTKQKDKSHKNTHKKANSLISEDITFQLSELKNGILIGDSAWSPYSLGALLQPKKKKTEVKKFPFEGCVEKKNKVVKRDDGTCPPKKSKKKVVDCPPSDDTCRSASPNFAMPFMYSLDDGKKKDKKCPKVNVGTCKDEKEEDDDDPCGRKRKPGTQNCPKDLLKKKRVKKNKKNQKKAASLPQIPPSLSTGRTSVCDVQN